MRLAAAVSRGTARRAPGPIGRTATAFRQLAACTARRFERVDTGGRGDIRVGGISYTTAPGSAKHLRPKSWADPGTGHDRTTQARRGRTTLRRKSRDLPGAGGPTPDASRHTFDSATAAGAFVDCGARASRLAWDKPSAIPSRALCSPVINRRPRPHRDGQIAGTAHTRQGGVRCQTGATNDGTTPTRSFTDESGHGQEALPPTAAGWPASPAESTWLSPPTTPVGGIRRSVPYDTLGSSSRPR